MNRVFLFQISILLGNVLSAFNEAQFNVTKNALQIDVDVHGDLAPIVFGDGAIIGITNHHKPIVLVFHGIVFEGGAFYVGEEFMTQNAAPIVNVIHAPFDLGLIPGGGGDGLSAGFGDVDEAQGFH